MRILIVNPFGIGDVLFTFPLVYNLKEFFPQSEIGYLGNKRTFPILAIQPEIDFAYVYEKDDWRAEFKLSKIRALGKFRRFLKQIKKAKFDLAFDLSLAQEFGFFLWFLGIKKRIGYDYKNRALFLNQKVKISGYSEKHMIEYYNDLLKLINLEPKYKRINIHLPSGVINWAAQKIDSLRRRHSMVIALIPGGGASWGKDAFKKRWPDKNFRQLAELIKKDIKAALLFLGDKNDARNFQDISSDDSTLNLMGQTSLLEFAALISKSDLVVTNDGGPLHIAVAFRVPTLSFFGPVPESIYGPYPEDKIHKVLTLNLPCRPCYKNFRMPPCDSYACLNKLDVDYVFQEFKKHLSLVLSEV